MTSPQEQPSDDRLTSLDMAALVKLGDWFDSLPEGGMDRVHFAGLALVVTDLIRSRHPGTEGDGWVRVPVEPTEAEIEAAASAMWDGQAMVLAWQAATEIAATQPDSDYVRIVASFRNAALCGVQAARATLASRPTEQGATDA